MCSCPGKEWKAPLIIGRHSISASWESLIFAEGLKDEHDLNRGRRQRKVAPKRKEDIKDMLVWNCLSCLELPSGLMRWESGLLGTDTEGGRRMIRLHQGEKAWRKHPGASLHMIHFGATMTGAWKKIH